MPLQYTDPEIDSVLGNAGLEKVGSWMDQKAGYYLLLLRATSGTGLALNHMDGADQKYSK